MAQYEANTDALSKYLTPGQQEALVAPKGFRRRARVAAALIDVLTDLGASPDSIQHGVDVVNGMPKGELSRLRGHVDDLRRSLGVEGLGASGVAVAHEVTSRATPDTTGSPDEVDEGKPIIPPTAIKEVPDKLQEEVSNIPVSREAEEIVQSVKTSGVMKTFIESVTGEAAPETYDGTFAGNLLKLVLSSGNLPETRTRADGSKIDAPARVRSFIEANGDTGYIAWSERVTKGSIDQWFRKIRQKFEEQRLKDKSEIKSQTEAPTLERGLEDEPRHVQVAAAWADYLKLEALRPALQELLDPNGSPKMTENKQYLAETFRSLLVVNGSDALTFPDIERKKLVKVWRLFGIGVQAETSRVVYRSVDPLSRRVALARSEHNSQLAEDIITLTLEGMEELLAHYIAQEQQAPAGKPPVQQVHFGEDGPMLVQL